MYVCGPTTYNYIHLGNARPIVAFDVIRRYFAYRGYDVTYVQNFTDVDDKIINRANEENMDPKKLAEKYIDAYFEDADRLGVKRADVHPRVTEHMQEIIDMVQTIIDNGLAYEVNGDVYYEVRKFEPYGKLSGRSLDEMQSGARIAVGEQKRDPLDFALWKAAKPGEPAWDSPWGKGRPGWHIECSAMSTKYLGKTFDIHGGGADLIFPHHENEIAQSEGCNGCESVHYWIHNGFITINSEKMSKSLGNFFLLRDILDKFPGPVVRFYLMSTHYRSPLDFDDQKLTAAEKSLHRIWNTYRIAEEKAALLEKNPASDSDVADRLTAIVNETREKFIAAMDDDFNTSLALASVFDLCRDVNGIINVQGFSGGEKTLSTIKEVLAFFGEINEVMNVIVPQEEEGDDMSNDLLNILMEIRTRARSQKDWPTADFIRDELKKIGIIIE
ncbi:MAG: cysteine--tRNA ligase, partial [Bacillota bacterium]|nr:cysteine--tRNA ligase [Bacillota bacterium]